MAKTKNKKKRTLISMCIALLLVCVLGAGALLLLKEEPEEQVEESYDIFTFNGDDVEGIAFTNKTGKMAFYKAANVWYNVDDEEFPVKQTIFKQIASTVYTVKGFRQFEVTEEHMEDFGLNDPTITFQFITKDGRDYSYKLGIYNKPMDGYYLYDQRENKIYMVEDTLSTVFGNDVYAYAEGETFPEYDITTFRDMTVVNEDKTYEFLYRPDGDETNMIHSKWYFGKPFAANRACVESKLNEMMESLVGLTYDKMAAYNITEEDLASFGIDGKKHIEISYVEDTKTENGQTEEILRSFTLQVGDLDETGYYYYVYNTESSDGSGNPSSQIHLIAKKNLDMFLNLDPIDYAYTNVISAALKNMTDITFDINGTKAEFEVTQEGDEEEPTIKAFYKGSEIELSKLQEIYGKWNTLFAKEFITNHSQNALPSDDSIVITIHQKKNPPMDELVIKFTEYNNLYYQVEVNGATDALVERGAVLEAISTFETVLESLN